MESGYAAGNVAWHCVRVANEGDPFDKGFALVGLVPAHQGRLLAASALSLATTDGPPGHRYGAFP